MTSILKLFSLVLLSAWLAGCQRTALLGTWEIDLARTLSQYEKVPAGYEGITLAEFRADLTNVLMGRAYNFTTRTPRRPEWGETNFDGSVEIKRQAAWEFFGAWRADTNSPGNFRVFAYTVNSGASYWPAGTLRLGTNELIWNEARMPGEQPIFLRRGS